MKERDALLATFQSNPKRMRELLEKLSPDPLSADEPISVLCMPWPGLVDDSEKKACARCGIDVAIAPSTQQMVAQHKAEVHFLCLECATAPVN